jgi:hypothetical protein
MNKNIKKIISTIIITISILTIVGCGQTNEKSKSELKEEIKQEIKSEELGTSKEEVKEMTKEDLTEFEELYHKYFDSTSTLTNFKLESTDSKYITIEQSKELKKQSDINKGILLEKTPSALKDSVESAVRLREEYINANYENRETELGMGFIEDNKKYLTEVKDKIAELHTQLDK